MTLTNMQALGIVLVVLFSSRGGRGKRRGGVGRKRYSKKPYKSKKKHLLDDKYYRNNKYRR